MRSRHYTLISTVPAGDNARPRTSISVAILPRRNGAPSIPGLHWFCAQLEEQSMFVPLSVLGFRDHAERYFRDKVGVVDGEKAFTYRQFAERTHRLANAMRSLGVAPGEPVSFVCPNTHQLLEAYYGVLEAGAVLNPINVRLTPADIAYVLTHSASRIVFFHRDLAPLVRQVSGSTSGTEHYVVIEGERDDLASHEYEELLAAASPEYLPPEIDENAVAELFYTSGTTGTPKGVALTHRSLHLHALYTALGIGLDENEVVLHVVPLFHVNGWGTPHFVTMMGGTHVMLRKFDAVTAFEAIERHRVTRLLGVPFIFNSLLNHPDLGKYDLSSLHRLVAGGAPSSPTLIRAMQEKLVPDGWAVVGYGLSETSPVATVARPREHLVAVEGAARSLERQAHTGWALPGVEVRVVDADGRDVRPDASQIGEIVIRSNIVMEGYYKDEAATRRAIRDGWFHTGDMATIDSEGDLLIRDRAKDIIISGGENISTVEIENVVCAHPDVMECAVVAMPDPRWGEAPAAFVVAKPGRSIDAEAVLVHCRCHLAGFKLPKRVVVTDALPKGGTGKTLKAKLREPLWQGRDKRVG
jgi:fatty-acyl-CoA synthase